MSTLDATRAELGLVVLYLNKAEARDKICRAIQYGSKFISNGQPGTAQDVDRSTTLARKVFRLLKVTNDDILPCLLVLVDTCIEQQLTQRQATYVLSTVSVLHLQWVNDLHGLISPPAKGTPLTLVLLGKVFLFFYKNSNKELSA